ncbi:MAG: hypothetical protein ACTSU4_08085 [Promethearchaeota archaeon]
MKNAKYCPECGAKLGGGRYCEKCGHDTWEKEEKKELIEIDAPISSISPPQASTREQLAEAHPNWKGMENFVSVVGSIAWLIGLINAIIYYIIGFMDIVSGIFFYSKKLISSGIWTFISATIVLIISLYFVKPRFSDPCSRHDWNALLEDYLLISTVKFPWMVIWGILLEIFGNGWAGIAILIPAFILLFMGPRPYNWIQH